jgi:hypothetical protein
VRLGVIYADKSYISMNKRAAAKRGHKIGFDLDQSIVPEARLLQPQSLPPGACTKFDGVHGGAVYVLSMFWSSGVGGFPDIWGSKPGTSYSMSPALRAIQAGVA